MDKIVAVILAAGKGTRLNCSRINKVARLIAGRPMIKYTVELLRKSGIKKILVVVGYASDSIKKVLGNRCAYVKQIEQLGTANAVAAALPSLPNNCRSVLVLNGDDSAFYQVSDIDDLIKSHLDTESDITLMTVVKDNPNQLGRIIRDKDNQIKSIVEFKNANQKQKQINEVNTATYCFKKEFLIKFLPSVKKNPVSGEYYLTELLELAVKNHKKIGVVRLKDADHFYGVNNQQDLELVNKKMSKKKD